MIYPLPRHDLLPLDKYWAPILGNYSFIEKQAEDVLINVFFADKG